MFSPLFEFFELIADELSTEPSRVLTRTDLQIRDEDSPLLDELKREMRANSSEEAIERAIVVLKTHFEEKGARLPFDYDPATGRFTATDLDFLSFIKDMNSIRSVPKRSNHFERSVAERLGQRVTGTVHRVGFPRDSKKKSKDFNLHLRTLGFAKQVLLGKEKDGGLDILWLLPWDYSAPPDRVSPGKNGMFDMETADASIGAGSRSLSQHAGLQPNVHVPCVLFNDYIEPKGMTTKQLNFVPLGLTDLAQPMQRIAVEFI